MRRSLRRRSRAAQALGVTPGQVLANPLPRCDMDFPGCGCSSGVEHDLAKVGVEGSNPFARSIKSMTYATVAAVREFGGSRGEAAACNRLVCFTCPPWPTNSPKTTRLCL